jgi:FkbM family methyltransferase
MGHKYQPLPRKGDKYGKAWGYELWIINDDEYCGKLLVFKKDKSFSMHYHLIKKESWYVAQGEFEYSWIDTESTLKHTVTLCEGDVVDLERGQPHQLKALTEGATVFEVSTKHYEEDSYRILPGSAQLEESSRGKIFYTKDDKQIDIRDWDQTLDIVSMGEKYGWEGAMAYGNLIHDELNAHGPGIKPGDVYLDLGANIGMSALRAEMSGASKIYCIEPDPGVFEALKKNQGNNWEIFNIAIADYSGSIDIPKWPDWWDKESRPCYTLEYFLDLIKIDHIDYMKVDIEGYELQVLPSIPSQVYSKIDKIFIEYHEDYEVPEDDKNMKRTNFILEMINKGYNNHHVALGYHQSFIYLWKS